MFRVVRLPGWRNGIRVSKQLAVGARTGHICQRCALGSSGSSPGLSRLPVRIAFDTAIEIEKHGRSLLSQRRRLQAEYHNAPGQI